MKQISRFLLVAAVLAWPLAAYSEAGDRQLQARVIDERGLAAESEPVVVNVSVQWPAAPPSPPLMEQVNDNWPLAAVALGGLVLAVGIGAAVWRSTAPSAPRQRSGRGSPPP